MKGLPAAARNSLTVNDLHRCLIEADFGFVRVLVYVRVFGFVRLTQHKKTRTLSGTGRMEMN